MKISELVEYLKAFDPDLPVVVGGFDETGFDDPSPPQVVRLRQENDGGLHRGKYADGDEFDAVVIDFSYG